MAVSSFDVRGRQFGQAKLWSSPHAFDQRAYFRTASTPAQLLVDDVKLNDEGLYRCRVDFRNSPTRNLKINLTVIDSDREGKVLSCDIDAEDSGWGHYFLLERNGKVEWDEELQVIRSPAEEGSLRIPVVEAAEGPEAAELPAENKCNRITSRYGGRKPLINSHGLAHLATSEVLSWGSGSSGPSRFLH
uniref:Ig-like domain-containing protein n=1 Tax=Timema douglasi TaxID=61478 RepID=A0A7R8VJK7_TIMDO|nr:unnamed protein product [Timema douglasi]